MDIYELQHLSLIPKCFAGPNEPVWWHHRIDAAGVSLTGKNPTWSLCSGHRPVWDEIPLAARWSRHSECLQWSRHHLNLLVGHWTIASNSDLGYKLNNIYNKYDAFQLQDVTAVILNSVFMFKFKGNIHFVVVKKRFWYYCQISMYLLERCRQLVWMHPLCNQILYVRTHSLKAIVSTSILWPSGPKSNENATWTICRDFVKPIRWIWNSENYSNKKCLLCFSLLHQTAAFLAVVWKWIYKTKCGFCSATLRKMKFMAATEKLTGAQ